MKNPGYQRSQPFLITDEILMEITGAVAEVEVEQIRIVATLTVTEKYLFALSMMDATERAGVHRLLCSARDLLKAEID